MIEKFIAEVPERIWAEGRPPKLRQWESHFNLASWVRISGGIGDVSLSLRWRDEKGEHDQRVDLAQASGDGSVLLSGMIRLRFNGPVEGVTVVLGLADPAMRYVVDELYMQRCGGLQSAGNKLISNY